MAEIEQTLTSMEVANMVEKEHKFLMRDIRRYMNQIAEGNERYGGGCKVEPSDFFTESIYRSEQNKELPCYRITKKGCEFIAHKLTGIKGTIFTARYINRFHEMQEIISLQKSEPELPWFIRWFRGKYIVLERDFIEITGYDIANRKPRNWRAIMPGATIIPGVDFNGWGENCDRDEFKKEYGFDYGTEEPLWYYYLSGVTKVLRLILEENRIPLKPGSYEMLTEGIRMAQKIGKKEVIPQNPNSGVVFNEENKIIPITIKRLPIRIDMVLRQESE